MMARIALGMLVLGTAPYGVPEKRDAEWPVHQGSVMSVMAVMAAQPGFRLLRAKNVGVSHDYRAARMPRVNAEPFGGRLAWPQPGGGHVGAPNASSFVERLDDFIGRTPR